MSKVLKLTTTLLLVFTTTASAWFTWSEEWGHVYISSVNDIVVFDEEIHSRDNAPLTHSVNANLPLTIWLSVKESAIWEVAVTTVELQWKPEGGATWETLSPYYHDEERRYLIEIDKRFMGSGMVHENLANISPGDTILIRLYIANYEGGEQQHRNANPGDDTGPTGDNSWEDQWVVKVNLQEESRPFWNIFGW